MTIQHINQPQQLKWTHNGLEINATRDSRIRIQTGGLTVDGVEPADAGYYEVIVIISNELGCESTLFTVEVECEFRVFF